MDVLCAVGGVTKGPLGVAADGRESQDRGRGLRVTVDKGPVKTVEPVVNDRGEVGRTGFVLVSGVKK